MDSRDLDSCPNCGHWWHPTGNAGSCSVIEMGERCGCRTRKPAPAPIVGISEIALMAGVKPDTVHAWRSRHTTFPEPAAMLARGPVWFRDDVAAWIAMPRRPGRPRITR